MTSDRPPLDLPAGLSAVNAPIMMLGLQPDTEQQCELPLEDESGRDKSRLISALDSIKGRYGKGTLHVGTTGMDDGRREWVMRQERRTPRYTTRWSEGPLVRA